MENMNFEEQIKADTERAIKRGWDASHSEWRKQALMILLETALSTQVFSVNFFRERLDATPAKTHDKRAVGGPDDRPSVGMD